MVYVRLEIMTYVRERTAAIETEAGAGAVVATKKTATTATTVTVTTTMKATTAVVTMMTISIMIIMISIKIIGIPVAGVVDVYRLDGECPGVHG